MGNGDVCQKKATYTKEQYVGALRKLDPSYVTAVRGFQDFKPGFIVGGHPAFEGANYAVDVGTGDVKPFTKDEKGRFQTRQELYVMHLNGEEMCGPRPGDLCKVLDDAAGKWTYGTYVNFDKKEKKYNLE